MKLVKETVLGLLMICAASSLFAQNEKVKKIVPAAYYDQLIKTGRVELIHKEGEDKYQLLPESEYNSKILENRVQKGAKKYPFVFEGLYYVTKDELRKESNSTDADINIEDVSRVLRSISKMKGMTYYSNTRKKNMTLYKKAYTTSGLNSETAVADKTEGSADGKVIYCLQDDASFGIMKYKLNYYQNKNQMYAVFNNTNSIGMGPITGIDEGNMKINVLVIDCGDSILLFLSTDCNCNKVPGIKSLVSDSMIARMNAVHDWFLKQF